MWNSQSVDREGDKIWTVKQKNKLVFFFLNTWYFRINDRLGGFKQRI
ncbi:mCG1051117 [Mus musculus]|nr:mCG1051117 [Mus musculus]